MKTNFCKIVERPNIRTMYLKMGQNGHGREVASRHYWPNDAISRQHAISALLATARSLSLTVVSMYDY
jgi:hypothetical protein